MSRLRALWRWGAWTALILVTCYLAVLDRRLVAEEPGVAYCPADTAYLAAVDDFPSVWRAAGRLDAVQGFDEALREYTDSFALTVRKATGIRPTFFRWRLWLGPRLIAAQAAGEWGFCARPGVLLRTVCTALSWAGQSAKDGVSRMGSISYAWRDGFLLFSMSEDYVRKSLTPSPRVVEPGEQHDEVRVQSITASQQGVLRMRLAPGIPIHGWWQLPPDLPLRAPRTVPMTLADAWPEPSLASITTTSWVDLRAWLQLGMGLMGQVDPSAAYYVFHARNFLASKWRADLLPKDWAEVPGEWSLALLDIDVSSLAAVPSLALAARCADPVHGAHPLSALGRMGAALPYEWEDCGGEIIPLVGEQWALCLSSADRDWLAASSQAAMARVAGKMGAGQPRQADFVLRLDWTRLSKLSESYVRMAADEELLAHTGTSDVDRIVMPWINGFRKLGALELVGRRDGNRVCFDGTLIGSCEGGR